MEAAEVGEYPDVPPGGERPKAVNPEGEEKVIECRGLLFKRPLDAAVPVLIENAP